MRALEAEVVAAVWSGIEPLIPIPLDTGAPARSAGSGGRLHHRRQAHRLAEALVTGTGSCPLSLQVSK